MFCTSPKLFEAVQRLLLLLDELDEPLVALDRVDLPVQLPELGLVGGELLLERAENLVQPGLLLGAGISPALRPRRGGPGRSSGPN